MAAETGARDAGDVPPRMPAMDLRRIRHFVVLAETLNFRRAAERLSMAQPPLSVSIQKLEGELGVKLFERLPAGVELTPSGRAVLPEARRLLFHNEQLFELASGAAAGTSGTLNVGFVGSSTFGMLQKLVPLFRSEYPGVELTLREATSARIVQMVEGDELDVGIVRTPLLQGTRCRLLPLTRESFVAALPRGNPLARKAELRLEELANEPFVMYTRTDAAGLHSAAMLACQERGFMPHIAQEATQVQTVLSLIETGLGVALVPEIMQRFTSPKLVFRAVTDMPASAAIGMALACRSDRESGAAQRFRALAVRELSQ
ncbi:LysR family transcriptional regulator [Ramlibacter sp. H39-3-26]|uniref:LysR family transcriptional regulator n=1 Tax=Curvibacter soli TaxID=3031331 RepID=UPI0023DC06ED|nr:LysR family transcriptional regulator [Ramlibacter sp. H39-3-26]MDF1485628.1 LysR family transcriptional regulator [Ramlibacter sp. H39-3-26]